MKIVGGKHKGRPLIAPKGRGVRPTKDRIREAIFNILIHGFDFHFENTTVLDLFCGTGALGLEAVSRGAHRALLIDCATASLRAAAHNIKALNEMARASTLKLDIAHLPNPPDGIIADLVFLDPPYGKGLVECALHGLVNQNWLKPEALVVVEMAAIESTVHFSHYQQMRNQIYGATQIIFLNFQTF